LITVAELVPSNMIDASFENAVTDAAPIGTWIPKEVVPYGGFGTSRVTASNGYQTSGSKAFLVRFLGDANSYTSISHKVSSLTTGATYRFAFNYKQSNSGVFNARANMFASAALNGDSTTAIGSKFKTTAPADITAAQSASSGSFTFVAPSESVYLVFEKEALAANFLLYIDNLSLSKVVTVPNNEVVTLTTAEPVDTLVVEAGGNVVVSSPVTVTGDLTFKADNTSTFSANLGNNSIAVTGNVNFVRYMDDHSWYFMSFPCDVTVADIKNAANGIAMGADLVIMYYDGGSRYTNGTSAGSNWKAFTDPILIGKKGYAFGIRTGAGIFHVKFPLSKTIVAGDTNTGIPVVAHGSGVNGGWNLVGQPYISRFAYTGSNAGVPFMLFADGLVGQTYSTKSRFDGKVIDPFAAYFVQIAATGDISFDKVGRTNAPAAVATDFSDFVRLNMTTATGTDNTNLIMDNGQSTTYEIGQDMEKWIGLGTDKPQIYTSLGGINYSYNALPMTNVVNLPIGVYTKTAGITTISVDATQAPSLSQLILKDNLNGATTNLLTSNYTYIATA
ncbi:MAG: hypothetical protein WCJ61_17275, partial [Paludibacter sp.]